MLYKVRATDYDAATPTWISFRFHPEHRRCQDTRRPSIPCLNNTLLCAQPSAHSLASTDSRFLIADEDECGQPTRIQAVCMQADRSLINEIGVYDAPMGANSAQIQRSVTGSGVVTKGSSSISPPRQLPYPVLYHNWPSKLSPSPN